MAKMKLGGSYEVRGKHRGRSVIADELEIEVDELELTKGPAEAARDAIAAEIRSINEPVSKATAHRPDHIGARMFNNTGTLVRGLHVVEDKAGWSVVPPSNRLQPGEQGDALLKRLVDLVDSLRNPLDSSRVRDAIEESAGSVVRKR